MGTKKIWLKNKGPKKSLAQKKSRPPKVGSKSLVSISSDIADTDKSYQDKCCQEKFHDWHLLKMVSITYLLSFAKIVPVTAEIFLIWTNIARTNVTLTVGIY